MGVRAGTASTVGLCWVPCISNKVVLLRLFLCNFSDRQISLYIKAYRIRLTTIWSTKAKGLMKRFHFSKFANISKNMFCTLSLWVIESRHIVYCKNGNFIHLKLNTVCQK